MSFKRQSLKYVIAKICCRSGLLHLQLRRLKNGVLILMYHKIDDVDDPVGLSISPDIFEQQILTLKKYFKLVSLDEAILHIYNQNSSKPVVAITLDDGYVDNYNNAFPLIQKHEVPAAIFLATGYISQSPLYWEKINAVILTGDFPQIDLRQWGGAEYPLNDNFQRFATLKEISHLIKSKPQPIADEIINYLTGLDVGGSYSVSEMMNWDQVREMHQSGFVTLGSHTVNHHILSRMPKPMIEHELLESRRTIEAELGVNPEYLAYPNGGNDDFNREVETIASQTGYKAAFSTIPSPVRGKSLYSLPRIDVTANMSCTPSGEFFPELFLSKIVGLLGY